MTAAFVFTGTHSLKHQRSCRILKLVSIFCSAFIRMDRHCDFYEDHGRNDSAKQHKNGPARLCRCGVFGALFAGVTVFSCIYFMITGEYDLISAEIRMVFLEFWNVRLLSGSSSF